MIEILIEAHYNYYGKVSFSKAHARSSRQSITRGMQSIVGRAELAIAVQPHRRAAELSGLLHIVLLYEVGIR